VGGFRRALSGAESDCGSFPVVVRRRLLRIALL
jgi:hypothetical protein